MAHVVAVHPVKTATIRHRDGRERSLLLVKQGGSEYQWLTPEGRRWEDSEGLSVVYAEEGAAIKALRVAFDTDPALVGADLTIRAMEPPAEERTARKILDRYGFQDDGELAGIIRKETNVAELTEHGNNLLAFVMSRRDAYAKALFPVVNGLEPRDLVLDGLLLSFIEALEASMGTRFKNLTNKLREPIQQIVTAHRVPPSKAGDN